MGNNIVMFFAALFAKKHPPNISIFADVAPTDGRTESREWPW
jgi:hypothetical protein